MAATSPLLHAALHTNFPAPKFEPDATSHCLTRPSSGRFPGIAATTGVRNINGCEALSQKAYAGATHSLPPLAAQPGDGLLDPVTARAWPGSIEKALGRLFGNPGHYLTVE
jgi:hypothetical protein